MQATDELSVDYANYCRLMLRQYFTLRLFARQKPRLILLALKDPVLAGRFSPALSALAGA
jgi:hypothetical protein